MLKAGKSIIFTLFIVTLFSSLKMSFAATVQKDFGNYLFVYAQEDSILAKKLFAKVQNGLANLQQFFGKQQSTVITVSLTSSRDEYRKHTRYKVPEWSQAVAFTNQRYIVLRLANADDVKQAPQTLLHELVHMHIAERVPGGRMPVWLNEGLAQYLSKQQLGLQEKVLISNALAFKKIIHLSELDSLLSFSAAKARLGYAQALSAVEYFVRKNGRQGLQELVQNLAKYRTLNQAFIQTIGIDFIDFELNWYQYLVDNYRWLTILNLDNFLWLLMGILAILAIIVVRHRNRKKLAAWQAEIDAQLQAQSEDYLDEEDVKY